MCSTCYRRVETWETKQSYAHETLSNERAESNCRVLFLQMLNALLAGEHWSKNEQYVCDNPHMDTCWT